jgi:O-antigen/teichoic acid export membrane protein
MREHLANAAWGVLDYIAYPLGMLLVAPFVLRKMGTESYGVWTVAAAVVTIGSIVASGFSDANIQQVAYQRGGSGRDDQLQIVRCMVGIHLLLATLLGVLTWMLAPLLASHVVALAGGLRDDCLRSIELAAALLWVRAMESVCISTQRAFARYGAAVRVSLLGRMLSLSVVVPIALLFHRVAVMLAAALVFSLVGTAWQYVQLGRLLGTGSLSPQFDLKDLNALLAFGKFSWLLAVAGVVFNQADRLYLGISSGASTVASYALCTQLAQPIWGIAASGLHFLFPHLAERRAWRSVADLGSTMLAGFVCNFLFVIGASAALVLCGPGLLRIWAGKQIALRAAPLLPVVVAGTSLLAMNVTATYSLYAFRRIRIVTTLNLAGGAVMLLLMIYLTPRFGALGPAYSRLGYGLIMLSLYVPLLQEWKGRHRNAVIPPIRATWEEI